METIKDLLRLAWRALLLQSDAYATMAERPSPFVRGLILIVIIGVLFSLTGIVGTTLERLTTPDMGAIKEAVRQGLQEMSWYRALSGEPEFVRQFSQGYDLWWQIFGSLFTPNPLGAVAGIITNPFGLILGWLVYGLLAHLFARLLGGQASLGQTYGATALSASPQLLNLANFIPYVEVGGVVGTWALICNFLALKTAHRLTTSRAFWATVLPFILLFVIFIVLGIVGVLAAGALLASLGGAR